MAGIWGRTNRLRSSDLVRSRTDSGALVPVVAAAGFFDPTTRVWVRAKNTDGATVTSRAVYQPPVTAATKGYVGSGGVSLSGAAAKSRTKTFAGTGGTALSGAAATSTPTSPNRRAWVRAKNAAGAAVTSVLLFQPSITAYTGTGGVSLSGAAAKARQRVPTTSGGVLLRGAATTSKYDAGSPPVYGGTYAGTGGFALSGFAFKSRTKTKVAAGGFTLLGAALTVKQSANNKRVWVRAKNAAGATVTSVTILQPNGGTYVGTGGLTLRGAGTTAFANPYQVTLASVNPNSSHRLQTYTADLAVGNIVEWGGTIVGGTAADVTVNNDGTWSVALSVSSFQFRVFDGTSWGAWGTQSVDTASTGSHSYNSTGGVSLSGAAPHARTRAFRPTGGVTLSGTPPRALVKTASVSGGAVFSGAATKSRTKAYTATGGTTLRGAAGTRTGTPTASSFSYSNSGGVQTGGVFARSRTKVFTPAGGFTLGGTSGDPAIQREWGVVGLGGFLLRGSAATATAVASVVAPSPARTATVARESRGTWVTVEGRATRTAAAS